MSAQEQLEMLLSARAFDGSGTKVGDVRQVYLDDSTGRATFATVSTGIFSADAIVPLFGARLLDGELHLEHSKSTIKSAPRFDHTEDALTPEQELDLLEHFGIEAAPLDGDATDKERDDRRSPETAAGSADGSAASDDAEKAEPGTIPARRLASVEEPRETSGDDVTTQKAAGTATATGAPAAAAATGDKPGKADKTDKAEDAADKAGASANAEPQAEKKVAEQSKPGADKDADGKDRAKAPATKPADSSEKKAEAGATGSLASKLAATAKQSGKDDAAARPSSIEKKATDTAGNTDGGKDSDKGAAKASEKKDADTSKDADRK